MGTDLKRSDAWEGLPVAMSARLRQRIARLRQTDHGKMPLPRKLRKSLKSVPLDLGSFVLDQMLNQRRPAEQASV